MKMYIRNMGCESCKIVVKEALEKVGVRPSHVELGEVEIAEPLDDKKKAEVNADIKKAGLEILDDKKGILLEKIKAVIIDYVNNRAERLPVNFSTYLSNKLNLDYSYLSNYFSGMQATTIEQYMISLRTEKVKEMIIQTDLSLKEIAYELHYSSVSHLSKQFKKVTGLSPTHFKKLRENRRFTIQQL